jgi:hypothetical protein
MAINTALSHPKRKTEKPHLHFDFPNRFQSILHFLFLHTNIRPSIVPSTLLNSLTHLQNRTPRAELSRIYIAIQGPFSHSFTDAQKAGFFVMA